MIVIPKMLDDIFSSFFTESLLYLINISVISLFNITAPIKYSIDACLLDNIVSSVKPDNINKSDNLIFTLVNAIVATYIPNSTNNFILSANTTGKCSFIFFVLIPCIVFIRYVYGVSPRGVSNPVNKHIINITISHFTLS